MTSIIFAALMLRPANSFVVEEKITYKTVKGTKLQLDLYRPASATGKVPIVMVIHGGGWMMGKREEMGMICEAFAKKGVAAATISYRLAPKSKWPAMLEDCYGAQEFLVKNADKYGLDRSRMALAGGSAGAHLALLTAMRPATEGAKPVAVRAVLNVYGPTDLEQDFPEDLRKTVALNVVGKPLAALGDGAKQMSPLNFVSADAPPIFTIHGEADALVPIRQSERLDEAMKRKGRTHVFRRVPGLGHGFDFKNSACVLALQDGIDFVVKRLKQG